MTLITYAEICRQVTNHLIPGRLFLFNGVIILYYIILYAHTHARTVQLQQGSTLDTDQRYSEKLAVLIRNT